MSNDETPQHGDEWVIPPEDAPGPAPGGPPRRPGRLAKIAAPALAAALVAGGAVFAIGHGSATTPAAFRDAGGLSAQRGDEQHLGRTLTGTAAVSLSGPDSESDDGGLLAAPAPSSHR